MIILGHYIRVRYCAAVVVLLVAGGIAAWATV